MNKTVVTLLAALAALSALAQGTPPGTLNVLPLDSKGRSIALVSRALPGVNEFKTGIYDIDRTTVLVRLDSLQQMLKMDAARIVEESPNGAGGIYDPPGDRAESPPVRAGEPRRQHDTLRIWR